MNELLSNQIITSREIASLTGKRHDHVLDAIRTMEQAWINAGQPKFRATYYTDNWNRKQTQYDLIRDYLLT